MKLFLATDALEDVRWAADRALIDGVVLPDAALRDRNLYLASIEVTAPKAPAADAASAMPANHRRLLLSFAARAFRRPVADDEVTPYAAIVEAQLQRGASFELAMLAGYKGILCAPDFLIIGLESGVPQPAKTSAARLGDYALASRLAFFLWNSMPDATLLVVSDHGFTTNTAGVDVAGALVLAKLKAAADSTRPAFDAVAPEKLDSGKQAR